jgi:hypothetical protein
MAAEMVSSAVAQVVVNQVLSRIKEGYQDKSDAKENLERMEMAHIKLEAPSDLQQVEHHQRTSAALVEQAQARLTGVRQHSAQV